MFKNIFPKIVIISPGENTKNRDEAMFLGDDSNGKIPDINSGVVINVAYIEIVINRSSLWVFFLKNISNKPWVISIIITKIIVYATKHKRPPINAPISMHKRTDSLGDFI